MYCCTSLYLLTATKFLLFLACHFPPSDPQLMITLSYRDFSLSSQNGLQTAASVEPTETSVWYSDYIQIEVTAFFRPTKKKRNGFFCVNLHRSSFRGASLVLRWVLTGGAASCRGLHPPWSQPAQEASLSSLHPSWKLLLISKCHKFHSPLSLGALAKGGEHRGGEKGKEMMHSFFLSFSLSSEEKAWCWHSSQSAASQIPFPIWSVGAQHETAPAAGTSKLLIFQRVHHFADVWWNAGSFSRHSLWFYLLSVAHPNSHYILLLCHPYANKRNCCSSEL